MNLENEVRILIEPLLEDFGVELFDIVWGGGRLKITVDAPGGIDTTLLSTVSRTISQELDIHDPIPSRYTLEVSSPGLERRLRRPEHYAKSIGCAATVKLTDGQTRLQGTIVDADQQSVTLKLSLKYAADLGGSADGGSADGDSASGGYPEGVVQTIPYAEIARAQTVFVWPAGREEPNQSGSHRQGGSPSRSGSHRQGGSPSQGNTHRRSSSIDGGAA